jgi:soluble lytic murein transglycosylase
MLPITRSTESNSKDFGANGKPVTSTKGAKYAMQVMPATARKPGFGIKPAANDSPEEYNRVGTELLGKLTDKYGGDASKAWAAYNAGTGRIDHALRKHGDNWLQHMPAETRDYVAKNTAQLNGAGAGTDAERLAGMEAQKPLEPTGPTQYQTAEPGTPDLPGRPADRGAAQSYKYAMAQRLMATRDPALMQRAMAMLDDGMGEQFASDRDALGNNNTLDRDLYDAGVNDHFHAAGQKRDAAYEARGDERREGFAYGREMRGYAHDDNTLGRQQSFSHNERIGTEQYDAGQNDKNRDLQWRIANLNADTKSDIAQKRFQNFLNTPAGNKMYNDTSNQIAQNNALSDSVDQFLQLNEQTSTGGMLTNTKAGSWVERSLDKNLQNMDSLVHDMAPKLRQAGAGSMSDRDLEMFEKSIPNIGSTREGNAQRGAQFKAYISRINDFQMNKLEAASSGKQVEFLHEWNAYKTSVKVLGKDGKTPGMSFSDWKASIPQYDAQGNRK